MMAALQPAGRAVAAGPINQGGLAMTVAAMLRHKGREVVSIRPTESVAGAVALLAERRIGAVVVRDAAGVLCGVLSERDIVAALARHGSAALAMTADRLMTREVITGTLRTTTGEAMALMTEGRFRHLPIVEHGDLVGLVSIGDVVKARLTAQEGEVESLRAYVVGTT
jgi:CBS domain-containing protein